MKSKQTLCVVLALALGLAIFGCSKSGGSGTTENNQGKTQGSSSEAKAAEAQDISNEILQLNADVQAGKISMEEYQRRIMEIRGGLGLSMPSESRSDRNYSRITENYRNAGWPPASVFSKCKFPQFKQPAGTTARYKLSEDLNVDSIRCYVHIKGANGNTVLGLAKQAEKAFGEKIEVDDWDSGKHFSVSNPKERKYMNTDWDDDEENEEDNGLILSFGIYEHENAYRAD